MKHAAPEADVAHYLRTGESDYRAAGWPGSTTLDALRNAKHGRRSALLAEVRSRTAHCTAHPSLPDEGAGRALTRQKVEPMVRGLFPRREHDRVLELVEGSVVFLGPDTIAEVILRESFDSTAWQLANLYLGSFDLDLLGPTAPSILGMSQETTCYVSQLYFDAHGPFDDFLVHEVAHIFHNWKREYAGMPFTRGKQWLLEIAFAKRETFAYSCEVFACIQRQAASKSERVRLANSLVGRYRCPDERVDSSEVVEIVTSAAASRNGWSVIRDRCAPQRRQR